MIDPLRSLFLDVGVDDKKGVDGLQRITAAGNAAEKALLDVARAAKAVGGATAAISVNQRLAASYNAVAAAAFRAGMAQRQAAIGQLGPFMSGPTQTGVLQALQSGRTPLILQRPSLGGAGDLPFIVRSGGTSNSLAIAESIRRGRASAPFSTGVHAMQTRTGRGNYGLGTSVFLTLAGAQAASYGYRQSAGLERGSQLAAFASGQTPAAMAAQNRRLARQFHMRLPDAISLTREVAQLGVGTEEGRSELARAGAGFNVLESTVAAGDAASSIYRLIKATSRSTEELNAGTAAATRYAAAIFAAGNESAAGAGAVFQMVQELEPLAQFMKLGANGTIALSAAFADLNENQRELFRGAITRMTIEGKLNANDPISSLLGIANRLRDAGDDLERMNILKSLGFDNIRDVQTAAVMAASLDTFARALAATNEELTGVSTFWPKISILLKDQQGDWDNLTSSMDNATASIVGKLAPALGLVMGLLAGIADVVAGNPILSTLFGYGAAVGAYVGLRGLYRRHFGGAASAEMLADMLPSERRAYGRTSRELAGFLPLPMSKRLGFTAIGANMAEGSYLARLAGGGRMNRFSLGLMRALPFVGEGLATRTAATMAAGGLAGAAVKVGLGPIGWIIAGLTAGAPLFSQIAESLGGIASQGGAIGATFNMLALVFDVVAAGGRILNRAFSWIGTAGKWLLNLVTFGHADDVLGGINQGITGARDWVKGIAADETAAGAQTAPKAPASAQVNIYQGGSRSGAQMAIDEVARRAARTMPANSYSGIVV